MFEVGSRDFLMKTLFLIFLGVIATAFFLWFYYLFSLNRSNYSAKGLSQTYVDFTIKPGEKVYEIAQHLKEERLVNSATLFKIYVKLNNLSGKLQAGSYKIPINLTVKELAKILQHGTFDVRLTFPEGWRREEMAQYLSQSFKNGNGRFSPGEFLKITAGKEGYLFPDTYVVPYDTTAGEIVRVMTENFERKARRSLLNHPGRVDLDIPQLIILASIVEREANREQDRPIIAGILFKRLRSGWPLEADATVQYALSSQQRMAGEEVKDWWPKSLTQGDLEIDSPYNTRRNVGLPPAPICNPGLSSMLAVVNSVETPYWFYLTDRSGETHYAKTLEEHAKNISRFLLP